MDDHANLVSTAIFTERMAQFIVDVSMIVDLSPYDPLQMQTGKRSAMGQDNPAYRRPIADQSVLECFLSTIGFFSGGDTELSSLTRLAQAIATRLHYMRRMEPGVWPPAETLAREAGSCRDSAWLLIALARNMGYAARFVSGYLVEPSALQADPDRLVCDLHAWAEICIPGSGWVGFDTTSGRIAAQNHIPLAASDAPETAAPVSGLLDLCVAEFDVMMQAHYLHREPMR